MAYQINNSHFTQLCTTVAAYGPEISNYKRVWTRQDKFQQEVQDGPDNVELVPSHSENCNVDLWLNMNKQDIGECQDATYEASSKLHCWFLKIMF